MGNGDRAIPLYRRDSNMSTSKFDHPPESYIGKALTIE